MNLEKILRGGIISMLFLLPLIPFIVLTDTYFLYIVGKNFAFRALVDIVFIAWIVLAYLYPQYRLKKSPILISIGIFVAIVTVADLLAENSFKSILSNFERMEGLVTTVHLLAYTVVMGSVLNTKKLIRTFWSWEVSAAFYLSLSTLAVYVSNHSTGRMDGALGNPIYLAVFALFNIFIATLLITDTNRKKIGGKIVITLFTISILIQIIALFFTATRGASIGLFIGIFIVALGVALTSKGNKLLRNTALTLVAAVVVFVSLFIAMRNTYFVQNNTTLKRFANISLSSGTVMARTYVWRVAWEGVKEKPLLGWGQENFSIVFNKYYHPRMYKQEVWFDRAHNIVFDWWIAAGTLGLLAYISIFLSLLYILYKTTRLTILQKWIFVGLFAGYTFHNLTVFDNIVSYILFFGIVAWLYSLEVMDTEAEHKYIVRELPTWIGGAVVMVASLLLVYTVNNAGWKANHQLLAELQQMNAVRTYVKQGNDTKKGNAFLLVVLKQIENTIDQKSIGRQEIREQLVRNATSLVRLSWVNKEVKDIYTKRALLAMDNQISESPHDAKFFIFKADLYEARNELQKAREELAKARILSPKKQVIIIRQASNAGRRNEMSEALEFYKQAYELDTSFKELALAYARALEISGDKAKAVEILLPFEISLKKNK